MKDSRSTLLALLIIILLFLLINPFNFYMATMMTMWFLLALFVVSGFFATYVWKEHSHDEREEELSAKASRSAFLLGTAVLLIGIVVEYVTMSDIDVWLTSAFGVMVISKILVRKLSE